MDFNKEFDASGLACPLPIVKTKKALVDMTSGQVLRVISTDPGSVCDMAAFAEQTGNALLEQGSEGSKFVFISRRLKPKTRATLTGAQSAWQPRRWR